MLLVRLSGIGGCILGPIGVEAVLAGGAMAWLIGADCWGCCGGGPDPLIPFACLRFMLAISMDCERGPVSTFSGGSEVGGSALLVLLFPQCAANRERLSSIGVKILCVLEAGSAFGCGIGGLLK